ncbi:hypothetical protein NADFUDRAFT_82842, partial [Nadsonia fulvescens var. elongata DSM 6958]
MKNLKEKLSTIETAINMRSSNQCGKHDHSSYDTGFLKHSKVQNNGHNPVHPTVSFEGHYAPGPCIPAKSNNSTIQRFNEIYRDAYTSSNDHKGKGKALTTSFGITDDTNRSLSPEIILLDSDDESDQVTNDLITSTRTTRAITPSSYSPHITQHNSSSLISSSPILEIPSESTFCDPSNNKVHTPFFDIDTFNRKKIKMSDDKEKSIPTSQAFTDLIARIDNPVVNSHNPKTSGNFVDLTDFDEKDNAMPEVLQTMVDFANNSSDGLNVSQNSLPHFPNVPQTYNTSYSSFIPPHFGDSNEILLIDDTNDEGPSYESNKKSNNQESSKIFSSLSSSGNSESSKMVQNLSSPRPSTLFRNSSFLNNQPKNFKTSVNGPVINSKTYAASSNGLASYGSKEDRRGIQLSRFNNMSLPLLSSTDRIWATTARNFLSETRSKYKKTFDIYHKQWKDVSGKIMNISQNTPRTSEEAYILQLDSLKRSQQSLWIKKNAASLILEKATDAFDFLLDNKILPGGYRSFCEAEQQSIKKREESTTLQIERSAVAYNNSFNGPHSTTINDKRYFDETDNGGNQYTYNGYPRVKSNEVLPAGINYGDGEEEKLQKLLKDIKPDHVDPQNRIG